ncbi:MAG TPA: hypothetical protein PLQ41_05410 [bacterium]|nr:hypothetical protein [bacterium]HPP30560.1 hypothetical protein [bacterium]
MKRFFFLWCILFLLISKTHCSTVFLQITKNLQEKADIVVLLGTERDTYWDRFLSTIKRDLIYSGYFNVEEAAFVESPEVAKKRYATQITLQGIKTPEGIKIVVEDNLEEKILFEKYYRVDIDPSYLAHTVNDDIVLSLTGKPGIARSRILFVSDATGKYEIYCIDYDGENLKQLTSTDYMVHYPRWLTSQEILYISYEGGWPKLVKMNFKNGEKKNLLAEPGLNACASPSIKTGEIAVVLSKGGRPDIYVIDFGGKIKRQITASKSTDASPSFSPDGSIIAFVSDRYGSPQIYTMTKDGARIKRISFISNYSTSPAYSPDGNYIAYVFQKGTFGLAIYEISTGETKIIGESLGCEDVSWAPDSRHIIYTDSRSKPSSLVIMDIISGEKRYLNKGKINCFSPSWSQEI